MADRKQRLPANVPGAWFVDATCIDCDVCRQLAPDVFAAVDQASAVVHQPTDAAAVHRAELALLACPVGSIGAERHVIAARDAFPVTIEAGVSYCGYTAETAFGANAFFVERDDGNVLIDAPRFVSRLVHNITQRGGVADILLTHRDDVADAEKFARHFGARVWIHEWDQDAAPFATDVLRGTDAHAIRGSLIAIPVPGHTLGSVVYLLDDRFLFTGDSLCWDRAERDLHAFRNACWYSWDALKASLEKLTAYRFEWVLAGHGDRIRLPAEDLRRRLHALVARM